MTAGGSVAARTADGTGQLVDGAEHGPFDPLHEQLGDAVATGDPDGGRRIVVDQVHQDLATVTGVDRTGRVEHRDAQAVRQTGAGMHQADTALGQGQGDAGRHQLALAGGQFHVRGGDQVGTGVTRVGVRRQGQIRVELADRNVHSVSSCSGSRVAGRTHPAILPCPDPAPRRTLTSVTSDPGPATYHERLGVPWWAWPLALITGGLLATEVWMGASGVRAWLPFAVALPLIVIVTIWLGRIKVAVTDTEFQVDDARLPLEVISEVVALDAAGVREVLGVGSHPLAFVVQRPWITGAVQVVLDDPADPTPFWVVSTRHPVELATALLARVKR